MKAEWTYLAPEVAPLDLPIADKIWKHLPRRIDDKIIAVNFFSSIACNISWTIKVNWAYGLCNGR